LDSLNSINTYTKELKKIIEERKGPKLLPIPEDKKCNGCGIDLTHDNITQGRIKQYIWFCDDCIRKRLARLHDNYRYAKETDHYEIDRHKRVAAPRIRPKDNLDNYGSNFDLVSDLMKDTEEFRIDQMMKLVTKRKIDMKEKRAAVSYLLKSFDLLSKKQCVVVINALNKIIADTRTSNDVKVRMAEEARVFLAPKSGSAKEQQVSTYEKMLQEEGEIELDE